MDNPRAMHGGVWRYFKKKWKKIQSPDPLVRFEIMRRVVALFLPDYRFQWPQMGWWHDQAFNAYLTRFHERHGMNSDRRWTLYQLTRLVAHIQGDSAECGVYQGAGSWLIAMANTASPHARHHFVFDSFAGISHPLQQDGSHWTAGDLSCDLHTVAANLAECPRVHLLQGWIPDRFAEVAERRFAFVHLDVDLYQPTLDSLTFFYPRLLPGGILICDDYGMTSCPGATLAVNEFLQDKPEKMVTLSCGGGFFIKGTPTAQAAKLPEKP